MVVSCVVPPIMHTFEEMVHRYLGVRPLVVGPGIKTGIPVHYENPKEVGSDRIANAVATVHHHGVPAIVVDFGTATSFDAISRDGAYLGGAIAPGIWIATEALFLQTAKLPRIDLCPSCPGHRQEHRQQPASGDHLRLRWHGGGAGGQVERGAYRQPSSRGNG